MTGEPLVTVVIPTRDRTHLLRVTLHSVLAAVAEAEMVGIGARVLVVDDAPTTSGTRQLAGELGVDYELIEEHDGRDNPASAIIRGVAAVRTPYLTIFGDDDIMLPRFLRAHVERLQEGYDLCSGSMTLVDGDLVPVTTRVLAEPHLGDLLAGSMMINDGAMVRTELVQRASWDPTLDQVVLYPVWLEVLIGGARTTTLSEPTWWYRRHRANISSDLGERDRHNRTMIRQRYTAMLLERDGVLPEPRVAPAMPAAPTPAPTPAIPAPPQPPSRSWLRRRRG